MADKFDHTEKDIKRALKYWEKKHLLQLEYNSGEQLTGICLCEPVSAVTQDSEHAEKPTEASSVDIRPSYTKTRFCLSRMMRLPVIYYSLLNAISDILCPSRIMKPFFTGQMN